MFSLAREHKSTHFAMTRSREEGVRKGRASLYAPSCEGGYGKDITTSKLDMLVWVIIT